MIVNKAQFCAITGWTAREFDGYLALGLPATKKTGSRGEIWQVDTREAVAWIVSKAVREVAGEPLPDDQPAAGDVNAARARLLKLQGDMVELQAAELRGRLVDVGEVRRALAAQDVAVKDRLLAIGSSCAARAVKAAAKGEVAVARVIEGEVRAALTALSSATCVPAPER